MKKWITYLLILGILLLNLTGCMEEKAEIATMLPTDEPAAQDSAVSSGIKISRVSTVDEFLKALNSNTIIELAEGSYNLNWASDYGQDTDNPAYYWENNGEGYQLVLSHLHDLTIRGSGRELTTLMNSSIFSNILTLDSCKRVTLQGFTAGHSSSAEPCTGGVIQTLSCQQIRLSEMGLFGSGAVGIHSIYSDDLTLDHTDIYDCSYYGLQALESRNIFLTDCNFYDLGSVQAPADAIFLLSSCSNVHIENSSVTENLVSSLLTVEFCDNVTFKDSEFKANKISACAFQFSECQPVFENTDFEGNNLRRWYASSSMMALDEKNAVIGNDQLPPVTTVSKENLPAQEVIHVSTMDELLKAIGPDRDIILGGEGIFDLSSASDYGTGSSDYYRWNQDIDGPELIISDVDNMTIRSEDDAFSDFIITAIPRYSNVLSFVGCSNISLSGFTAGHSEEPGFCTGGVLFFDDCDQIEISRCGLYGCGILGVDAKFCAGISVKDCKIYDCSFGGMQFWGVSDLKIQGNEFWDLGGPEIMAEECSNVETDVEFDRFPGYGEDY